MMKKETPTQRTTGGSFRLFNVPATRRGILSMVAEALWHLPLQVLVWASGVLNASPLPFSFLILPMPSILALSKYIPMAFCAKRTNTRRIRCAGDLIPSHRQTLNDRSPILRHHATLTTMRPPQGQSSFLLQFRLALRRDLFHLPKRRWSMSPIEPLRFHMLGRNHSAPWSRLSLASGTVGGYKARRRLSWSVGHPHSRG